MSAGTADAEIGSEQYWSQLHDSERKEMPIINSGGLVDLETQFSMITSINCRRSKRSQELRVNSWTSIEKPKALS